jgi:DUF1680 family protein
VNALSGAAMAYRVTGNEKYLAQIENAYDVIIADQLFVTGGYGPREEMFITKEDMYDSLMHPMANGRGHCEVPCCAWAAFKLCRYLLEFTGKAKYAEWMEKLYYNSSLPLILPDPGGRVQYYTNYYKHGAKKSNDDTRIFASGVTFEWPCCSGTYPQLVAEYANMIYFASEDMISVAQYIASDFDACVRNSQVKISMQTRYPEEENIRFVVSVEKPVPFTLRLRVPAWADAFEVQINGKKVKEAKDGGWFTVTREWSDGDIVNFHIPMALRLVPFDLTGTAHEKDEYRLYALMHGPVVFATGDHGIMQGDLNNPSLWITPDPDAPGCFVTRKGHIKLYPTRQKRFKPFYAFEKEELYFLYSFVADWLAGIFGGTV